MFLGQTSTGQAIGARCRRLAADTCIEHSYRPLRPRSVLIGQFLCTRNAPHIHLATDLTADLSGALYVNCDPTMPCRIGISDPRIGAASSWPAAVGSTEVLQLSTADVRSSLWLSASASCQ